MIKRCSFCTTSGSRATSCRRSKSRFGHRKHQYYKACEKESKTVSGGRPALQDCVGGVDQDRRHLGGEVMLRCVHTLQGCSQRSVKLPQACRCCIYTNYGHFIVTSPFRLMLNVFQNRIRSIYNISFQRLLARNLCFSRKLRLGVSV